MINLGPRYESVSNMEATESYLIAVLQDAKKVKQLEQIAIRNFSTENVPLLKENNRLQTNNI